MVIGKVVLNMNELWDLFNFLDDSQDSVVLEAQIDGHSGAGVYAYSAEYPEEGSIKLGTEERL